MLSHDTPSEIQSGILKLGLAFKLLILQGRLQTEKTSVRNCCLLRPARLNHPYLTKDMGDEEEVRKQSKAEGAAYLRAKRQETKSLKEAEGGHKCGEIGRV